MIDRYTEGKAEGEARGIEKGVKKGIEQIAINMLKVNKSVGEIILLTGLSQHAIEQLHSEME